ncbi:MAG: heavy metal translocating P-type ATPase, partial [Lachnospiraceae bacterium]|nr:heavy metal translocating P-type ATPase [Lachnospiraceae bacterium]
MEQYRVTGMSCAACQSRVEKAVSAVEGVESCAVSLLTNSMGVEGTASPEAVIAAVEAAGYGASRKNDGKKKTGKPTEDDLKDTETPKMKKRLIASLVVLLPLLYVTMGHMFLDLPLPAFLDGNHVAMGLYELLLSGLVLVINQKFFISGFKGLLHRAPNMDSLVALGAGASWLYSVVALFAMSAAVLERDSELVMYYHDQFYFEAAAMILTLITVGKMLEARSKGKTTNALKALMKLAPQTAVRIRDGVEETVAIEELKVGDQFAVRPGDSIPVDGVVLEGESAVNEAALTGESIPVEKRPEERVFAATINTSGYLVCKATGVGEDTSLSAIIRMVSDAAASKAPIAKIADRVSAVFVPAVLLIALITFAVWLLTGQSVGYALARAVSVLVISCPCALGLATPVAIMVGNGVAAKTGILFKTAASLEQAGKTQIVVLDKTGTITGGAMKVTELSPAAGVTEEELLRTACALESKSEHPISGAITGYAREKGIIPEETTEFEALSGNGLKARLGGAEICGGKREYIREICGAIGPGEEQTIESFAKAGKTPVLFAKDKKLLGIIAVSDVIREDSGEAVEE